MTKPRSQPMTDHKAYWLITFVYYVDTQACFDTAIHDGTLTEFVIELNEHYQTPSIVCYVAISKAQYTQLEGVMDAVDEDAEQTVEIGGGVVARIPAMDDEVETEEEVEEEDLDEGVDQEDGMHDVSDDPDVHDEGDARLDRDELGLDDSDFDGVGDGGEFDET